MRIISGQARGRKLVTLEGENTRPTLDRTRESLFNILRMRVLDAKVLDLFAGSGALALESLSRGAQSAVLCDASAKACAVIEKNIDAVRVRDRAKLLNCDACAALVRLKGERFDLVFLDPPYNQGLVERSLVGIIQSDLLSDDAIIVAETAMGEVFCLPDGLRIYDTRRYGKSLLHFIERA